MKIGCQESVAEASGICAAPLEGTPAFPVTCLLLFRWLGGLRSGLGFLQEPTWWRFDSGLEKTFPIRESLRFEFSFRVVDPLNHAYWGHQSLVPGLDLSKPATFGTMAGSYIGNRQIGFVGRFAW